MNTVSPNLHSLGWYCLLYHSGDLQLQQLSLSIIKAYHICSRTRSLSDVGLLVSKWLKIASGKPPDPALQSAISPKNNPSRIGAASALPFLGLCQLSFCTMISEICCLDAKTSMTHPSHPTWCHLRDRSDCFPYSGKTKRIHSMTRDHLPQAPTHQAWVAVAVMAPWAASPNVLVAWHWP